jgi:pantothenate synthetase
MLMPSMGTLHLGHIMYEQCVSINDGIVKYELVGIFAYLL